MEKPKRKSYEKIYIDEIFVRQLASNLVLGKTTQEIAKDMNIAWDTVKRLSNRADVKALVKEIGESSVSAAKAAIKLEVSRMVKKIIDVIHKNLDEGNLEAVKIGLKVVGALEPEPIQNQASQINVILPGDKPAPREVINEENKSSGDQFHQELGGAQDEGLS